MKTYSSKIIFFTVLASLLSVSSFATDVDNFAFVGAQTSEHNSNYVNAGFATPFSGSSLGNGWVFRGAADYLTYSYKSGENTIDAYAYGLNASLGYQWSNQDGWFGFYAGPGYIDTTLSPDDRGNKSRGGQAVAQIQAEGEEKLSNNFKINAITNYTAFDDDAYWGRVRLLYKLSDKIYAGPEAVLQGDNIYRAWQTGVVLTGIEITPNSNIGFVAGVGKTKDFSESPYAGVEMGLGF